MKTYAMTGGASGIGAAIKQAILDTGHQLIVVDLANADIEADLSSERSRKRAIEAIQAAFPDGLDGLITCAGVGANVPNLPLIASVNYLGSIELVEGLKASLEKKRGAVVFVSSNSAPSPGNPAYVDALLGGDWSKVSSEMGAMEAQAVYSGSKQAVARWMRRNTAAYASCGIRMNAIAPGYTETPMTAAVKDDAKYGDAIQQFLATIPMGRSGLPRDMANAVSFLLSDKASFICGSVLFIDGGHDAMHRPDQI